MQTTTLLNSPCTSFWLKDAIISASKRDPLDALRDAETLVQYLQGRLPQNMGAKQAFINGVFVGTD